MTSKLSADNSPLVSICIPTYNGERWISDCIDSALNQTYSPLEILIVDDGSKDQTVELVRKVKDQRVRLVVNPANCGLAGNWNECVRLAKGDFIKFLFQDDAFYPQCVERMMQMFVTQPQMGMVFARRDVVVEDDAPPELAHELLTHYRDLHLQFEGVQAFNQGRRLFDQHLEKKLYLSCVAEPPSTLIHKEVFRHLGLFNTRMHQACDIEMWLRIMFFYDVGFCDEKLLIFRVHGKSASSLNYSNRAIEYDRFWLLDGLLSYPEIKQECAEIVTWRDDLFRHYRNSLIRPRAGWRSIGTKEGCREAVRDAWDMPNRIRFLREVEEYRRSGAPLHERL
jgi:glycosyltransferase involved in cell wall biosynthesis